MDKKRLSWIAVCMCFALTAAAQQYGIVRTLERPGKASEALAGVTINVLEYPNAIVSKKDGRFSFVINSKHQGESFTITRVQKKGYSLVDKQLKGRRYAYSSLVPVEIVMVADAQLEKDKKRIEDKAYNRAKNDYDKKVAVLEKQLKEKAISEREYHAKQEELNTNYNNYVKLIDQMAERYATTDYKGLSEINRQILACIENAELERADSLINSKGSFEKREQELASKQELIERTQQLSRQLQDNYDAELQDLIQDYYNKHTIHAAAYSNDSAAYYLERMVDLSPNDVSMIKKTGDFIETYLADHHRALKYYQLGFDKAQELQPDNKELIGSFCVDIGSAYNGDGQGDIEKALEWHNKALDFYSQMEEPDSAKIAYCYLSIGKTYIEHQVYDKGKEYTLKSIQIYERAPEQNAKDLSTAYGNLGVYYSIMEDYGKSLEYQLKAIDMKEDDEGIAYSHVNIGIVYLKMQDYDKALDYYQKALDYFQRVYGPTHPTTIATQSGIGSVYYHVENNVKALEHYQEALKGSRQYYGNDDKATTYLLKLTAELQFKLGEKDQAQQDIQQVINAIEHTDGAESIKMAQLYIEVGNFLRDAKDFEDALECYHRAQAILQALGVEDDNTASVYGNAATIHYWLGQYDKSLECYLRVLDILKGMNREHHPTTAMMQKTVGDVYNQLGNKQLAIEYFQLALDNMEQLPNSSAYESFINEIKATMTELRGTD